MSTQQNSHSWKTEFQKRKSVFSSRGEMENGDMRRKSSDESGRTRRDSARRREMEEKPSERSGVAQRRMRSPTGIQETPPRSGGETPTRTRPLPSPPPPHIPHTSPWPINGGARRYSDESTSSHESQRSSMDGQRPPFEGNWEDEDDQLTPLGRSPTNSTRRARSQRGVLAAETGQKERMYSENVSPASQSQSDLSEGEDNGPRLSAQISTLMKHNQELQKDLRIREQERDQLRKQINSQWQDRSFKVTTGLPSKLLDGRVIRERERQEKEEPLEMLPPGLPVSMATRRGSYGELSAVELEEKELIAKITRLEKENLDYERHLHELSNTRHQLESDLVQQREAFVKIQVREQDLAKDVEILRDENLRHQGTLSKVQTDRDRLQSENETLHEELEAGRTKLVKTEKFYKEVEHENLSLEAEINKLVTNKKQLLEQREKLQSEVERALKTKEDFRSIIGRLHGENQSLESKLTQGSKEERKRVVAKPPWKVPESKEKQVLSEVMLLREEQSQLKEKLGSAKAEIDSLRAALKEQEVQEQSANQIRAEYSPRLSELRSELVEIGSDLKSTKDTVSSLESDQQGVVHGSFMLLAERCRGQLDRDRTQLTVALKRSESSLAQMEADVQHLRLENSKLHTKKGAVAADVKSLHSEIAALKDQKRLLERQISQHESLSQEKDKKVLELETQRKQLQDKLASSERSWKNEFVRLERERQDSLAEANTIQGNLYEEQESLLRAKVLLESQLSQLQIGNEDLLSTKEELQLHVRSLESHLEELSSRLDQNAEQISSAEETIGRLLAEKACSVAQMIVRGEESETQHSQVRELKGKLDDAVTEKSKLKASLDESTAENAQLQQRLEQVSENATKLDQLTTKLGLLTNENTHLRSELDLLTEKHQTAIQHLQQLAEDEQTHHLDNQKLKMTLMTEIELLKGKLKTVGDEKLRLEEKLSESMKEKDRTVSAFQAVPESKQVEQLKMKISAMHFEAKQQRKSSHDSREHQVQFVDLQGRLAVLESENKRLKESVRSRQESFETSTALRKQVYEMTRKTYFLESDKKRLVEKVDGLENSMRIARETKDRFSLERVQKLEQENQGLHGRIRSLEDSLTKKLMAADLKIAETVKENDKLRQNLLQIQSSLSDQGSQGSDMEEIVESLKSELDLLHGMRSHLASTQEGLHRLEVGQRRVLALQSEIDLVLSAQASHEVAGQIATMRRASVGPGVTPTLPPVLQHLPPAYLSSLQGTSARPKSAPYFTPTLELREKLSQLHTMNLDLNDSLRKHQALLKNREDRISSLHKRFSALDLKLQAVIQQSRDLQQSVAGVHESELKPDQLQTIAVLQKQIESLQDQVIDRDSALQDITVQMKTDYEEHNKKFSRMTSQVRELRKQLSSKDDSLRTKDQYIQQTEERSLDLESQLAKAQKEIKRVLQERDQLVTHSLSENPQLSGMNISDIIRAQGEETQELRKVLSDFSFELSQAQSQLDAVQREKSMLQSKAIEMEKMHVQMKEAMNADINYLRRLNLQLVEQQMKAGKATEVLQMVKAAQETFREQRDRIKLEAELDSCKVKLHEQERKISDLEQQIGQQHITIKLLQTEKNHAVMLNQYGQDLTNQITPRPTPYIRPRSAESARKPKWTINSGAKTRISTSGRNIQESEFSIALPTQDASQGSRVDILNLEEQSHRVRSFILGPPVVTDDEAAYLPLRESEEKAVKPPRVQKLRNRGHRRTASTGSNIIPHQKEREPGNAHTLQLPHLSSKLKAPKYPKRPGSAGSTRPDVSVKPVGTVKPPESEHIAQSAKNFSEHINMLIESDMSQDQTTEMGIESSEKGEMELKPPLQAAQPGKTKHKYSEMTRSKQANKSTDSNENTSSSESTSAPSKSQPNSQEKLSNDSASQPLSNTDAPNALTNQKQDMGKDLARTESMSSTCSGFSLDPAGSILPSRNPSFAYYGGESSPYSHDSLEIGDSVENLQALGSGRLPYPYTFQPIPFPVHKRDSTMTSSSDEDTRDYRSRRKRSSGNPDGSHETPHHKDRDDNSNSSCDSDQLQRGFHGNKKGSQPSLPLQRNESISISDMEKYSTDVENDEKVADLQKRFGRVRYSSTGSVKICYSDSTEDVSKHL